MKTKEHSVRTLKTINFIEKNIINAFDKIKSGDRSDLLSGNLFQTDKIRKIDEKELWEVRKYIKNEIHNLEVSMDGLDLDSRKDFTLKLALYDQMKDTIKTFMDKKENLEK